jgi:hypothetical protein
MRKAMLVIFFIILGVSIYYYLLSNPLPPIQVLNELIFTPDGWILEIVLPSDMNTDGWYLVTKQDTAYLKPMGILSYIPYLITQDSLLEALNIDQNGDELRFYSSEMGKIGHLNFGVSPDADIAAPKTGQSICYTEYYYYLDNTPTLGQPNDTTNTTGYITGWIKDSNNIPLRGVRVGGYDPLEETTTDSTGFFKSSTISRKQWLYFSLLHYQTEDMILQVWPESTITTNMTMYVKQGESVERIESQTVPKDFSISEPFPNPFNPETRFHYTLPRNGEVIIDVFDVSGKLVDKVFAGYQPAGSYQARWNATHLPSGIYFIQVRTSEAALSKKCILVK